MPTSTLVRRQFLAAAASACVAVPALAATPPTVSALPSFQLGLVTYNLAAEWDLPTLLRICKETDIAAVELRTTHKHGVEPDLSAEKRREIKQQLADSGVTLWGLGTVCEFHSPDADVVKKNIETCKRFLDLAHDLDARGVKVRPNGLPKNVAEEKTLRQIGEALVPCGQAAGHLGLEVWVEVHGAGTSQPSRMKTIMETVNLPNVGVTWNSNKEDLQNGSVRASVELLKPWIKSCHINALYGSYPYRELFTCLKDMKYDRYTLMEIPEKLDPVQGTLLLKYYRRLWMELCG